MNRGLIGALSLSAASALLVACGESQPPIGTPGAMPQSGTNTAMLDLTAQA
ncbi:MAG TPA: hypothetical protein VHR97_07040 [Candidatus Baltobacteraceae bacterium]|jgi:hypothetical protein|nr:hypothetical protein [Candidatus Baltobacteraceae bacterium]